MKIDLVFPALPPALDGIGDHTALLAKALHRAGCTVRIRTAQPDAASISGVDVSRDFGITPPWKVRSLADAVAANPPDWLFVQFNQFSYGRYGFNPWLPWTLREIQRRSPNVQVAWMAHEDFVPPKNLKFALMRKWQRWQFLALGEAADYIFFSIDPWVKQYGSWFEAATAHLPVGSNIPRLNVPYAEARRRVGFSPEDFVVGVFGTMRPARLFGHIQAGLTALQGRALKLRVLYVGPDGNTVCHALPHLPVYDAGRLPAEDVSVHLSAMDLHLAPFIDGLSTRRGSAMAGLQHGIATVSTCGELTDAMLERVNGSAFLLSPAGDVESFVANVVTLYDDAERRLEIASSGRTLFNDAFSWDAAARCVISALDGQQVSNVSSSPIVA